MMKLNRFLFFPSPLPWPNKPNLLRLDRLKEWVDLSAFETPLALAVSTSKAGTIVTLVLVGVLFFLSLFFFPGPTLIFLRWLAISCFYICVSVFYILYVTCRWIFIALGATCRWIFIALGATCRCLLDHSQSHSFIHYCYRPILTENRPEYGTFTRTENRGETKRDSGDVRSDREKMKESYEYRRAMEAEWAARQRELQRQAEEARRQRSKRAENKSVKANERRQKQRTEQQKPETSRRRKDDTNLNPKEKYREEIREKLRKLEKCVDMSSLLRSLGIHIPAQPSPKEVRSAYKQACLKFHPDRFARANLRHQIEAEEKFKLISAMNHKLSSS